MSDEQLLAMLAGSDDGFSIDSDEINFDSIPKKSDLMKKKKEKSKIKMILPSESDDDPFTLDEPPPPKKAEPVKKKITIDANFDDVFCKNSDSFDLEIESESAKVTNEDKSAKSPQTNTEIPKTEQIIKPEPVKQQETNQTQQIPVQQPEVKAEPNFSIVQEQKPSVAVQQKPSIIIQQNIPEMTQVIQTVQTQQIPKTYVETKPSKPVEQMSPAELFEYSLLTYLERSTRDVSKTFIDEFSFLMNQATSYDSTVSNFLSDLNSEVKKIVIEEAGQIPPFPDTVNDIQSLINDQFAQISKQLPQGDGTKESLDTYNQLNTSINDKMDDFSAKCSPLLTELKQEVASILPNDDNSNFLIKETLQKQKQIMSDLEAHSYMQDLEQEYISRDVQRLKQMQVAYHEKAMSMLTNETQDEPKSFQGDIEALIDELSHNPSDSPDAALENYQKAIDQKIRDMIDLNNELLMISERICHRTSTPYVNDHVITYQQPQLMQSNYLPQDTRNEPKNEIVANVRERLESLRKRTDKGTSKQIPRPIL